MGVREKVNENKTVGAGVAAAFLVVGLALLGAQLMGGRKDAAPPAPTQAFYTDDNGKTFFKGDANQIVPFDHGGKQAYRADVFQAADGKQFVGLIYRFTDTGRRDMADYLKTRPRDPDGMVRVAIEQRGMQVKRVSGGEKDWVVADDVAVQQLQASMRDPTGKPAKPVTP